MHASPGHAAAFSSTADAYARTMAPALRPAAEEVVRRAELAPGERVLDIGTGTGTAAALAAGAGRDVVGLDAAAGMLEIARAEHPELSFVEADFGAIPAADESFDVVMAVHALHFAADRVGALTEWRRVTRRGGRLSLSVPGPESTTWSAVLRPVYERHDIGWALAAYPTAEELAGFAWAAGWSEVETAADPAIAIELADDARFTDWLNIGARGKATSGWSDDERAAFAHDLMAATPRDATNGYRLPFGALYLTARA